VAQGLSAEAIESGTGRSWEAWLAYFESVGASTMDHQGIVAAATEFGAPPWWGQMVTVAYERHIGRRLPGQRSDGSFAVSATRTLQGSLDDVFSRWRALVGSPTELSGVAITNGPDTSATEKWRYWRCTLTDGSRVIAMVSLKAPGKALLSIQHEQLVTEELGEHWRGFWKEMLGRLDAG